MLLDDETGRSWTAVGEPRLNRAGRFGTCIQFDGTFHVLSTSAPFMETDFTVEFFLSTTQDHAEVAQIIGQNTTDNLSWVIELLPDRALRFRLSQDGTTEIVGASAIDTVPLPYIWCHVALVRYGEVVTLYVDGEIVAQITELNGTLHSSAARWFMGTFESAPTTRMLHAKIDELRITRYYARYTNSFTPPSAPFIYREIEPPSNVTALWDDAESQVRLSWRNNSIDQEQVHIYRSELPFDPEAMPAAIAIVPASARSYVDTTASRGIVYHYMVAAYGSGRVENSATVSLLADGMFSRPTIIGEPWGGGFYAGDITLDDGRKYKMIMAPKASETQMRWATANTDLMGATSSADGWRNTFAASTNPALYIGPAYCRDYRGGGHEDWYLPAIDELLTAHTNLYPTSTTRTDFMVGGAEAIEIGGTSSTDSSSYWSSTLYYNNGVAARRVWQAVFQGSNSNLASRQYLIRPFRRLQFL